MFRQRKPFAAKSERVSDEVARITLTGDAGLNEDEAHTQLTATLDALRDSGPRTWVVVCSGLRFMPVDLVGHLAGDAIRLWALEGDLVFVGLKGDMKRMLTELGVLEVAPNYRNEKHALAASVNRRERDPDQPPWSGGRLSANVVSDRPGGVRVVLASGFLDIDGVAQLAQLLEASAGVGYPRIILNCETLLGASESGLSGLVKLGDKVRAAGGGLHACYLWGVLGLLVQHLGLDALIDVFPTVEDATDGFQAWT